MSEEIKNTPEEIEAVKAEDLEDTVEKENDAEAVTEDISTEEIIAEEPAAEAVAPAPVMKEKTNALTGRKADMSALDKCEKRFLAHLSALECVRLNLRTEIIT